MTFYGSIFSSEVIAVFIIIISTVSFLMLITKSCNSSKEYKILVIAYFIRLTLLFWDIYGRGIYPLPNSGSDSEMYLSSAINGLLYGDWGNGGQYSLFIANVYRVFGIQRILVQYVNLLLSMSTIVCVIKIMQSLDVGERAKQLSFLLICFLPNYVILSVIALRETLIITILTFSIFFFIRWWNKKGKYNIAIAMLLPLLAATYHSGSIAIIIGYFVAFSLYDRRNQRFRFNFKSIGLSILCIVGFMVISSLYGDNLFKKFNGVTDSAGITNKVETVRGGSGYEVGFNIGNPTLNLIINSPIRIFYFILSPLPWMWRGLSDVIAFVFSSLFYGYTLIIAVQGLKNKKVKKKELIILFIIMAAASAFVFAWGVSNVGTALRHRDKFLTVYLLLFAVSYDGKLKINEEKKDD